jgi:(R)-2-hydroxyacyl-CoA dehydratese activating ATPase
LYLGIDLGSRFVKLVYGTSIKNINYKKYDTIEFYKNFCFRKNNDFILKLDKIDKRFVKLKNIISTGYGRNIVKFKKIKSITEIEAHVQGALSLTSQKNFTLLDLGGQDSKIIDIKNRIINDFVMNEKCASGSGRYLENMADILDIPIEKIGYYYKDPVMLSNTCAIFGESEVISNIVEGVPVSRIASGVNYSIFNKIKRHIIKFSNNLVIFTGGLAKNKALKFYIEKETKKKIIVYDHPEFNGALGCFVVSLH